MRAARALCLLAGSAAAFGQTARPEFEVATVRPFAPQMPGGGLKMSGSEGDPGMVRMLAMSLHDLVVQAFRVKDYQVEGPDWTRSQRYDITAKVPPGTSAADRLLMEQNLLADRFGLAIHREPREVQVYALVVGRNGLKIQPAPEETGDAKKVGGYVRFRGIGHIEVVKISLSSFADMISRFVDHPVVDKTGVHDLFDFKLDFAVDPSLLAIPGMAAKVAMEAKAAGRDTPDQDLPSIFTAIQTLGLKLEPNKAPMDIIVIDHAEKIPIEN
jgi:uncharacterized protein (TIGR03435 family)